MRVSPCRFITSKRVVALKLTFGNFKHSYNQRPFSIILHCHNSCCPVRFLLHYLSLRGNRPGTLFLNSDNSPVSRTIFAELLSLSLKACVLDSTRYKGHSFRIGAASSAAERGMSDAQIVGGYLLLYLSLLEHTWLAREAMCRSERWWDWLARAAVSSFLGCRALRELGVPD